MFAYLFQVLHVCKYTEREYDGLKCLIADNEEQQIEDGGVIL